ncbi:MAG TPA: membrane protein insertion efficiency factor YidD [Terriglobales bacterium]|nr:membrane protein insertion efficiency factor YidD [Terriglobales bacterium]
MKRVLIAMLRAYQRWISPALPPACRYTPTCSHYAVEALEQRGLLAGLALATWRVLRCHPFVRGGYDPVPLPSPEYREASPQRVKN